PCWPDGGGVRPYRGAPEAASVDEVVGWIRRSGWRTGQPLQLLREPWTEPAEHLDGPLRTILARLDTSAYVPADLDGRSTFSGRVRDIVARHPGTRAPGTWRQVVPDGYADPGPPLTTDPAGRLVPRDDRAVAVPLPFGVASVTAVGPATFAMVERTGPEAGGDDLILPPGPHPP